MATRLRSIPCPASSRSRDRRESASTSEPWQRAATISRNSRSSSEAIPGGPRRTVSQRSCGAMPAWPFCYCLIVKIWTLVERPLLAQSGRPTGADAGLRNGRPWPGSLRSIATLVSSSPALFFARLFGPGVESGYRPIRLPKLHIVSVDEPPGGFDGGLIINTIQSNHANGSVV